MEAALALPGLVDEDRFHLDFALGKGYEDRKVYEQSFVHYAAGNDLRRQTIDYDANETAAFVDRSMALFTPEFFAERAGQGRDTRDPIFILGMPRAGSTLVEQILSSHSQVEGTSELPDIPALARDSRDYPVRIGDLSPERLKALGESYLSRTRIQRKTDRPFFIDKLPNNWAHVPFIHLILPNAIIVDARRHPLACGFSNFKQHFAKGQTFSYSLEDMGRYYADYVRLMHHVDTVLPDVSIASFMNAWLMTPKPRSGRCWPPAVSNLKMPACVFMKPNGPCGRPPANRCACQSSVRALKAGKGTIPGSPPSNRRSAQSLTPIPMRRRLVTLGKLGGSCFMQGCKIFL